MNTAGRTWEYKAPNVGQGEPLAILRSQLKARSTSLTGVTQMGQRSGDGAAWMPPLAPTVCIRARQAKQAARWPHGARSASHGWSQHTLHVAELPPRPLPSVSAPAPLVRRRASIRHERSAVARAAGAAPGRRLLYRRWLGLLRAASSSVLNSKAGVPARG